MLGEACDDPGCYRPEFTLGGEIKPLNPCITTKPGELLFHQVARVLFRHIHRLRKRAAAMQVIDDVTVADSLTGRWRQACLDRKSVV